MRFLVYTFFVFFLTVSAAFGQNDSTYRVLKDSCALPDTAIHKAAILKSDTFYKKLEKFSQKKNVVSRLVRSFIIFPTDVRNTPVISDPKHKEDERFKSSTGKIIRQIHIVTIDPFNSHINDTSRSAANWLEKEGNSIHITTRQKVISNQLLFKPNDKLDAFKLSESERLIRANPYITDARIIVAEDDCDDSVDVIVWAQDIFSISGGAGANPAAHNGTMSLNDQNFLGFGNNFTNKFWYDPVLYHPPLRYEGNYTISNIERSHISSNFFFSDVNNGHTYQITLNRPFFSSIVKWAGGYNELWHDQVYTSTDGKTATAVSTLNDVWAGYAFNSRIAGKDAVNKTQYFICARAMLLNYIDRPYFPVPDKLDDNRTYLISTGVSYRDYYKDNFIFSYGKTEDVPVGNILSYTAGVNIFEGQQRFYTSVKLSKAAHITNVGYIQGSIEPGGFYYANSWNQSVIALQALFFTEVENLGRWKIRQYLSSKLTLGYKRDSGELLILNDGSGLRGTTLPYTGTKKFTTNYEADMFAPKTILGFRTVLVFFADIGMLSNQAVFSSRVYQGYGIGLRLKNEHLIFPTAQFSFIFYVNTRPDNGDPGGEYYYAAHPYYKFQDFSFGAPYTLGFAY